MVPLTTVCSGALSLSGAVRGAAWILRCWERSRGSYAEASLVLPTRWGLFLGKSGACHDRTPLFPFSSFYVFTYNYSKAQKQWTYTQTPALLTIFETHLKPITFSNFSKLTSFATNRLSIETSSNVNKYQNTNVHGQFHF